MPAQPNTTRWLVPLLVLLLAAGIRLWHLSTPPTTVWDERYYAFDAQAYLGGWTGDAIQPAPPDRIEGETTWVHPPLGKWMIALLGVGPLGSKSLGWRVPAALFGIAGVGLLYLLAMELWGSVLWAGFASLMLALDGLHIVQSRLATLDIFVTTFITAGFYFLVKDKKQMASGPGARDPRLDHRMFGSPSRFWAGFMFGAAVATKWSGAFALLFAAGLCCFWLFRDRAGRSRASRAGTVAASFLLVPLVVYLASYSTFFWQHGFDPGGFMKLQLAMLSHQRNHSAIQPENSLPWTWPLLVHPIRYYGEQSGASVRRIVALGNPAIWWGFLLLLPAAIIDATRRPSWHHALVFGGYLSLFLPWFFFGRSQFLYYLLPAVPLMCLGVCMELRAFPLRGRRWVGGVVAAGVTVSAIALMPIWTGGWISKTWAGHLHLLRSWVF